MDDDYALFLAWHRGDKKAGAVLFDRHYEPIARFFHNKVDDAASADLVQSTFLACTEAKDRYRSDASFRTFLFSIAHNLLRKHYRTRRLAAARTAANDVTDSDGSLDFAEVCAFDLAPSPSSIVRAKEEQRVILESMRRIPIECQEVLELHYWEHMDTAEIAEILNVPQGTVKSRLQRGRRLLEEKIEKLSTSEALLKTTLSNLDGWARALRERLSARRSQRRHRGQ